MRAKASRLSAAHRAKAVSLARRRPDRPSADRQCGGRHRAGRQPDHRNRRRHHPLKALQDEADPDHLKDLRRGQNRRRLPRPRLKNPRPRIRQARDDQHQGARHLQPLKAAGDDHRRRRKSLQGRADRQGHRERRNQAPRRGTVQRRRAASDLQRPPPGQESRSSSCRSTPTSPPPPPSSPRG